MNTLKYNDHILAEADEDTVFAFWYSYIKDGEEKQVCFSNQTVSLNADGKVVTKIHND